MRPQLAIGGPPPDARHILHVVSELDPYSKSGGLADVSAALPRALDRLGVRVTVVTPFYRDIDPGRHSLARRLSPIEIPLGWRREEVRLLEGRLPGSHVQVYFLDHPLYRRAGYYGEEGLDYPDNGLRFALLCRASLEICDKLNAWPDVVHGHDWESGLAMLYAKVGVVPGRRRPATVFTIHNLAFQGLQPRSLVEELGLGWDIWHPEGVEFYDRFSFLKAGASYADVITTVSQRYAREIQTPEHGMGLDGYLRARADRIVGIVNGVDPDIWSPDRDPYLPVRYDASDWTGKAACKAALQRELGLPARAATPIIASVSRLTDQKGVDLILSAADELSRLDVQYVFLASGERRYEEALLGLRDRYPTRFAVRLGHDDALAHRIYAGSDMYLMPSRFEPCGLNQLYALRYGTIPIVRAVGGLDDTVVDFDPKTGTGSGFKLDEYSAGAVIAAVKRAITAWRDRTAWQSLVGRAMALDYTWDASARRYVEVYDRVAPKVAPATSS